MSAVPDAQDNAPGAEGRGAASARALAVALKYAPGDLAPKVVASGRGLVAAEIIARARAHGVFVHESPELVTLLSQVDVDDHIPPSLYVAVAELLVWLRYVEYGGASPSLPASAGRSPELE